MCITFFQEICDELSNKCPWYSFIDKIFKENEMSLLVNHVSKSPISYHSNTDKDVFHMCRCKLLLCRILLVVTLDFRDNVL